MENHPPESIFSPGFESDFPSPLPEGSDVATPLLQDPANSLFMPTIPDDTSTHTVSYTSSGVEYSVTLEVTRLSRYRKPRWPILKSVVDLIRRKTRFLPQSWSSAAILISFVLLLLTAHKLLFDRSIKRPVQDLANLADIARSLANLVYDSRLGVQEAGNLETTGYSIWNLSVNVRNSQMDSARVLAADLEILSGTSKQLAGMLRGYFPKVHQDIHDLAMVIAWASRELSQLPDPTFNPALSSAFDNMLDSLSLAAIWEDPITRNRTHLGVFFHSILGHSTSQRTRQTLHRTFQVFFEVLKDQINKGLSYSDLVMPLFDEVKQRSNGIARAVGREVAVQDETYGDSLSTLRGKILGLSAHDTRVYEENVELLGEVRDVTASNMRVSADIRDQIIAFNAALGSVKSGLTNMVEKRVDSGALSVGEQIKKLDEVHKCLEGFLTAAFSQT